MTARAPQKPKGTSRKKIDYTSPRHGGRRNPPALRAHYEQEPRHARLPPLLAWAAATVLAGAVVGLVVACVAK